MKRADASTVSTTNNGEDLCETQQSVDLVLRRRCSVETTHTSWGVLLPPTVLQACIDGSMEMVTFLLERDASVNQADSEGWTPLHVAASCGYPDIAEWVESKTQLGKSKVAGAKAWLRLSVKTFPAHVCPVCLLALGHFRFWTGWLTLSRAGCITVNRWTLWPSGLSPQVPLATRSVAVGCEL